MEEALTALIIDDSPTDRQTLSYLLAKKLGCRVETANQGVEGLDRLSRQRFDVVFLDVVMPLMSGVEVLQAIRSCRETANLPVVVISGQSEPGTVRALVQLKIFDYVLKPYNPEIVVKRFSKSLSKLRAAACLSGADEPKIREPVEQDGRNSVLIADEDANFRHFFATVLATQVHILEAANGAQAIAIALTRNPGFVFAGPKLGTYGRDAMARKLRSMNGLGPLKIYALVAGGADDVLEPGLYDGVVARSFVPETFLDSIKRVSPSGFEGVKRMPLFVAQLKPALISATEQVFGMMMSAEVTVVEDPAPRAPAPSIGAAIELVSYTEERRIRIALSCDRQCAMRITGRMLGEEPPGEGGDLVTSSLSEVMNIIGGRLKNTLGEQGREFCSALPEIVDDPGRVVAGADTTTMEFDADGDLRFSIALVVESCSRSRIPRISLREGLVLAQAVDVKGLGRFSKGFRLDAESLVKLRDFGPREIEIFDAA